MRNDFVARLSLPIAVLMCACAETSSPSTRGAATALSASSPHATHAYVGGTVITAPFAAPLADAVVLVDGARVVAVGPRASTPVPPGVKLVPCDGALVLPGFWNTHVHFT